MVLPCKEGFGERRQVWDTTEQYLFQAAEEELQQTLNLVAVLIREGCYEWASKSHGREGERPLITGSRGSCHRMRDT